MGTIGQRLHLARAEKGLTQEELSSLAGLSRQAVNELENIEGRNPRASTLRALSGALEIPLAWLMFGPAETIPTNNNAPGATEAKSQA